MEAFWKQRASAEPWRGTIWRCSPPCESPGATLPDYFRSSVAIRRIWSAPSPPATAQRSNTASPETRPTLIQPRGRLLGTRVPGLTPGDDPIRVGAPRPSRHAEHPVRRQVDPTDAGLAPLVLAALLAASSLVGAGVSGAIIGEVRGSSRLRRDVQEVPGLVSRAHAK